MSGQSAECAAPIEADEAAAYLDGALAAAARERLEAHLDECVECQWMVYSLARGEGAPAAALGAVLAGGVLPAGTRLGRYELEGPLGAGGMGIVYAARDTQLGRAVAIKAVREGGRGAELLEEAQAMARVTHPNVVSIYDLVEVGGRRFAAMERVVGGTLEAWLAVPRRPGELVEKLVEAGRGLAAIHAAGLVHGDFKPSNVLVEDGGRARVSDFGLARQPAVGESGAADEAREGAAALRGTPAYWAPELRRGEPATAASDQYAFCLVAERACAALAPGHGLAARRLRARLRRGLREQPGERYASMNAAVAALGAALRPRWRPSAVVAALVAVGAVLALGGTSLMRSARARAALEQCAGAADDSGAGALAGVWDAASREAVRRALLSTGAPYAGDAWTGVARALDRWAGAYTSVRRAACAATWREETQPAAVLAARLACLDDRRREARALVAELSRADRATASNAVTASLLLSPETCDARQSAARQPQQPRDAALAAEVAALREELRRIKALEDLGKFAAALGEARRAHQRAEALGFPPLLAEATLRLGSLQMGSPEAAQAGDTLLRAANLAEEVGDDLLKARALVRAIRADYEMVRGDRLAMLRERAAAALSRAQATPLEWAELHQHAGVTLGDQGQADEGERELAQALALRQSAGPAARYLVARTLASLGIAAAQRGRVTEALAAFRRAADLLVEELGPAHPRVGGAYLVLGQALRANLQLDEAVTELTRALEAGRDDDLVIGSAATSLGLALLDLGGEDNRRRAMAELLRAKQLWHQLRPDHPRKAIALLGIGRAHLASGNRTEAIAALEEARAIPGANAGGRAAVSFALAQALDDDGRGSAAERARARLLASAALAGLAADKPSEPLARRDLERVQAWVAAHGGPPATSPRPAQAAGAAKAAP